ncbi:MAG: HRDC domain-containing protein, partial [Candidatus Woesearchaeota archaeon]
IEDEEYRKIAYRKMWDMINFCKNEGCRRKILLNYFGEKYNSNNCDMCDNCNPSEKIEFNKYLKTGINIPKTKVSSGYAKFSRELFEVLRKLRKQIADKEKIPPYIVFSDVTLKGMASQYPQNFKSFLKISGVGEVKLNKYGKIFIEKIVDYCNTNNIV